MKIRPSQRYYRLLLLLYPRTFRERYAHELEAAFLESLEISRRKLGRAGIPYAWCRAFGDTLNELLRQRRLLRRSTATASAPFAHLAGS